MPDGACRMGGPAPAASSRTRGMILEVRIRCGGAGRGSEDPDHTPLRMTSFPFPYQSSEPTTLPSSIRTTSWARSATTGSCVTTTRVMALS